MKILALYIVFLFVFAHFNKSLGLSPGPTQDMERLFLSAGLQTIRFPTPPPPLYLQEVARLGKCGLLCWLAGWIDGAASISHFLVKKTKRGG